MCTWLSCSMPESWKEVFPDPGKVGQSEYAAIYDVVASMLEQESNNLSEAEQADLVESIVAGFHDWTVELEKRLLNWRLIHQGKCYKAECTFTGLEEVVVWARSEEEAEEKLAEGEGVVLRRQDEYEDVLGIKEIGTDERGQ